jgi:sensor histidine kinase YesM
VQNTSKYIWLIIISAIIVTILANVGLFNHFHKLYSQEVFTPADKEQYWFAIRIGSVGVVTELVMLVVFTFFNYSWKNYFIPKKNIFLIVLSNLVLLIIFLYVNLAISKYITKTHPDIVFTLNYVKDYFINHSLVLTIALVAPYMLLRLEKARAIEVNLIQLKEEKGKAELAALREQISPHFFFNTLSTLSTIVRNEDREAGLDFIQDISTTYRYTLTAVKEDLVLLQDELDFINSYVYLLQKRFGEKLQFEMDIPKEYMNTKIPPMSLQLLIENAMQHNIITQASPLKISLFIMDTMICISNNIQKKERVESFGIGLKNLKNRYRLLTEREINIERNTLKFTVKLPIIS